MSEQLVGIRGTNTGGTRVYLTLVLWLQADATYDDGTDLEADKYDVPPERFRRVVDALRWLRSPWKLGAA